MDLLILTAGVTDLTSAAVTSVTDLTPLDCPDDLPQLVLGSTEPLTVKFLTAASTYTSWTADATYRVFASLGCITADGTSNFTEVELTTVIANGKSGNLGLGTTALQMALELALEANPRASTAQLVLQVTVQDPSGYKRVYGLLPVTVFGRVPAFTPDNIPAPSPVFSRAYGYNAQSNSSGNNTVTPSTAVPFHTEIISVSGTARTSVIILDNTGRAAGDVINLHLELPLTASIVIEVRNASAVGTLLLSVTSDGSGDDAGALFVFTGNAFIRSILSFPL